jgi:hypothetical protein
MTSCPTCGTTFEIASTEPEPEPGAGAGAGAGAVTETAIEAAFETQPEPLPVPSASIQVAQAITAPRVASRELPRGAGWVSTIILVAIAFGVVVVGAVEGRPGPLPAAANMHFCTSGSAPTVNLEMTIGASGTTSLTNVPNGHCAVNEKFVTGSTLEVTVWNSTGVGEVACTIVRNGHRISTDRSSLREKPAVCSGRA